MNKALKVALATTVLAMGIIISPQVSLAADNQIVDINGPGTHKFYDKELKAYITPFETTENGLVPITQQEYQADVNNPDSVEDPEAVTETEDLSTEYVNTGPTEVGDQAPDEERNITYWSFKESSSVKYWGDIIKVTPTMVCNTSSCSMSRKEEATVSKSYSVSASTEIKAINAGASFTMQSGKSASTSFTYHLKKGQAGYIGFKPYKRKTTGTLTQYSTWYGKLKSKSSYGRSAIKTSKDDADGDYIFVFVDR